MKVVDRIKTDETLLSWARYTIRYNRVFDRTSNFMDKIKWNKVRGFEDVTYDQFAAALRQIAKEDKQC